jgi:hypothetical protein
VFEGVDSSEVETGRSFLYIVCTHHPHEDGFRAHETFAALDALEDDVGARDGLSRHSHGSFCSREFIDQVCRPSRHGGCLGTDILQALKIAKFDGVPLVLRSPVNQARLTKVCGEDLRSQSSVGGHPIG